MVDILGAFLGTSKVVQIGDLKVDATMYQEMSFSADTTDHNVEEGSDITDHHKPAPKIFTIEGSISSVPLGFDYPGQTTVNSFKSIATGNFSFTSDAQNLLIKYLDDSELITIKTPSLPFENMMIVDLVFPKSVGDGDKLPFSVSVKQLRIVRSLQAGLLALGKDQTNKTVKEQDSGGADSKTSQAKPKENNGNQSTNQATGSENSKGRSVLKGLKDSGAPF